MILTFKLKFSLNFLRQFKKFNLKVEIIGYVEVGTLAVFYINGFHLKVHYGVLLNAYRSRWGFLNHHNNGLSFFLDPFENIKPISTPLQFELLRYFVKKTWSTTNTPLILYRYCPHWG